MTRINWPMLFAFFIIVILIAGAVIIKKLQPVDAQELKTQVGDLKSAASEGIFIAGNVNRQTERYFENQLEDLEQNVSDSREGIEKKNFDPVITDQRQKYIDISKQVSDQLHQLSLSFEDPNQLASLQEQLKKLSNSLENLQ